MNHDTSSPEVRNWGMGALGTLLVLASVPLAAFVWSLLPEGRYPVIVVAVP